MIKHEILAKYLSKQDMSIALEIIHDSVFCADEEGLKQLMRRMNDLIACRHSLCGLGKFGRDGELQAYVTINASYPAAWLDDYIQRNVGACDPIMLANNTKYGLQYFGDILETYPVPEDYLDLGKRYGLSAGYVFGIRNRGRSQGSLFCFADDEVPRAKRTELILELTLPHLHQSLVRIANFRNAIQQCPALLSAKESEVINWVKEGKSTWDIAVILNISERTVKFHIGNILEKLDAMNRSHAVAIALDQGLIAIDGYKV